MKPAGCMSAILLLAPLYAASVGAGEPRHQRDESRMSYLDNGTIRLGIDLSLGGAITFLSSSKDQLNVVNNHDCGRQIQMSHYSGPVPFVVGDKRPHKSWTGIGWNPIQSGDVYHNRSQVLEHRNDGRTLYVKCVPMHWPLENVPRCAAASRTRGPTRRSTLPAARNCPRYTLTALCTG